MESPATDDRGRRFESPPPQRIISLVPSITETVWALGAGERLIGATRYCTHPAEVAALPKFGGTKNPDCAGIIAARPDVVLMSEEENRVEDFKALEAAGIPVFVSTPKTLSEVMEWVGRFGQLLGCETRATALRADIDVALAAVRDDVGSSSVHPRVFCPIWKKPWMSFNADTYAHAVLEVGGAANICAAEPERYCVVTLEALAARQPELILLPDEPYPFKERDRPALAPLLAPTGPARTLRLFDGRALSWYGAHSPAGLRAVRAAVRGEQE